jgi:hypothetical protein
LKISSCLPLLASGLLIISTPVSAQRNDPVGPRAGADTAMRPHRNPGGARLFTSVSGVVVGAVAGAVIGYRVLPHECGCDDPGLDAIVYGGLAGMTIGAALGAAAPNLGSVCSFETRLGRSLLGAVLFAGAAYVASGEGEAILMAIPVGAVGGSLAALGRCWKSQ